MKTNNEWMAALLGVGLLALWSAPSASAAESATKLDRFVSTLAGGWAGESNTTPIGPMPFALIFERDEDGSLHAHSAMNRETYIDLRFHREQGRWILTEEAAMEGLGRQAYSLTPTESGPRSDGMWRWSYPGDPQFLVVDIGIEHDTLSMNVLLRGEEHARFKLAKLPKEEIPELARQLKLQALQPPETSSQLREPEDAIGTARATVTSTPEDAGAHLALAKALGAAIQENQAANGPRYAFEMLETLRRAIELDPYLVEAYHHLVGFYLNAPPFAGGSIDKAEELAKQLAEFDPTGGQAMLQQVEAHRSSKE